MSRAQSLTNYIGRHYGGSQADFARAMTKMLGKTITPQQVYRWAKTMEVIVVNGRMYFPKHDLSQLEDGRGKPIKS